MLVTVDVPVAGARLRDKRNGLTIPPQLAVGTVIHGVPRPGWLFNFLTTEPLAFVSLSRWSGTVAELLDNMFDPTVTYEDLAWKPIPVARQARVKGVQSLDDARRLAIAGIDAVTLPNHGGRQLDRTPVPLRLLPDVARELGNEIEIHRDTGITSGAVVVVAIALGARFTWLGAPISTASWPAAEQASTA